MRFELDDSTLLKVSGAAALAFGASAVAAPRNFHDLFHTSNSVFAEPTARHAGVMGTWLGTEQLVLSARDNNREAKKDMLKVAGFGWLACAGTHVYNAQNNLMIRDVSTATAVGQAVLGGLCLYKGFEDRLD